ncbi:MAG: hypothetical protein H6738_05990 [Alphaproteobacteria bacterium]|nr:hypothetical protein [Myxococcales bacterium]MCB9684334.1 hypothetical protein [Alphaproteobacteria bacterium]MCB9696317.1 hypothetical protein [Alphaproteobacteria bacterium]
MRPAVLAAALTFDERLAWLRAPVRGIARRAGSVVMRWLDRRRETADQIP